MKHLNTTLIVGLVLNILSYLVFFPILADELSASEFSYYSHDVFISYLWLASTVSLFLNILAFALITKFRIFALTLGFISSLVFIPISMIFLVGLQMANQSVRYQNFETAKAEPETAIHKFPFGQVSSKLIMGGIAILLGGVVAYQGVSSGGVVFFAGGLFIAQYFFEKDRLAAWITKNSFAFCPYLFCKPVVIPMSTIVLIGDKKITVKDPITDELLNIRIPLQFYEKAERTLVLQKLSAALHEARQAS